MTYNHHRHHTPLSKPIFTKDTLGDLYDVKLTNLPKDYTSN